MIQSIGTFQTEENPVDLFETIERRHSYRGAFHDAAVPREDLERIVRAGLAAPSGKNAQTTTFVVVDDPELLNTIHGTDGANKALRQARAVIACIVDTDPEAIYDVHHFQIEDCAAAVENMLLAITSLGYASVWIDGWLRVKDRARTIGQLLGIPNNKIVRVILPVGSPAEEGPRMEKKPFDERAWFNRYRALS